MENGSFSDSIFLRILEQFDCLNVLIQLSSIKNASYQSRFSKLCYCISNFQSYLFGLTKFFAGKRRVSSSNSLCCKYLNDFCFATIVSFFAIDKKAIAAFSYQQPFQVFRFSLVYLKLFTNSMPQNAIYLVR